jgi:hypothetical protein
LLWRYNPKLPPAALPERQLLACMDALFLEVLVGAVSSVGHDEYKHAQDAPFSVQEWQGDAAKVQRESALVFEVGKDLKGGTQANSGNLHRISLSLSLFPRQGEGGGGVLETMQSQQLMQMQLMQQMQRLQLQQLQAVASQRRAPPPPAVAPTRLDSDDDAEEEEEAEQGGEGGSGGGGGRETGRKTKKKKLTAAELQAQKEDGEFRKGFVSAFEAYEGERFPIGYLQPADVAVLFEAMGLQRFAPKVHFGRTRTCSCERAFWGIILSAPQIDS